MTLSSDEKNIINKHRRKNQVIKTELEIGFLIINMAKAWADYAIAAGIGLSYSEFCDGFNADDRMDEKYQPYRKMIFEGVKSVHDRVDHFASDLAQTIVPEIDCKWSL